MIAPRPITIAAVVVMALATLIVSGNNTTHAGAADISHSLTKHILLPPQNPPKNYLPISNKDYLGSIDGARAAFEGLGPLRLNMVRFDKLTVAEQVFVMSNLERISRGLSPAMAMMPALDASATVAARHDTDPVGGFAGIAASVGGAPTSDYAFVSDFGWMYGDGPPPYYHVRNIDCPIKGDPDCWGHRDAILTNYLADYPISAGAGSVPVVVTGTAYAGNTPEGPWVTQTFDVATSIKGAVFTWAQAIKRLGLPVSEQGAVWPPTTTTTTVGSTPYAH